MQDGHAEMHLWTHEGPVYPFNCIPMYAKHVFFKNGPYFFQKNKQSSCPFSNCIDIREEQNNTNAYNSKTILCPPKLHRFIIICRSWLWKRTSTERMHLES